LHSRTKSPRRAENADSKQHPGAPRTNSMGILAPPDTKRSADMIGRMMRYQKSCNRVFGAFGLSLVTVHQFLFSPGP